MQVGPDGQIIMPTPEKAVEPPPMKTDGSAIDASAKIVQQNVNTQAEAVQSLGGKIGGRRSLRRKLRHTRRYRGGAEVEAKNIPPNMITAGNSDPKGVFANMLELQARATADSVYDQPVVTDAPPRIVGGKRSKKRSNGSARRVHHNTRKHRRTARKHRGVRHSRRRVRSHK